MQGLQRLARWRSNRIHETKRWHFLRGIGRDLQSLPSRVGSRWHATCEDGLVKEEDIKQVEFIGGPEDGRLVDSSLLESFEFEIDAGGQAPIPLLLRMDDQPDFEAGDEVELQFLGVYVAQGVRDGRLRFEWMTKPAA